MKSVTSLSDFVDFWFYISLLNVLNFILFVIVVYITWPILTGSLCISGFLALIGITSTPCGFTFSVYHYLMGVDMIRTAYMWIRYIWNYDLNYILCCLKNCYPVILFSGQFLCFSTVSWRGVITLNESLTVCFRQTLSIIMNVVNKVISTISDYCRCILSFFTKIFALCNRNEYEPISDQEIV